MPGVARSPLVSRLRCLPLPRRRRVRDRADAGRPWRLPASARRFRVLWPQNDHLIVRLSRRHRVLEEPIEEQAARVRLGPVEAEDELVEGGLAVLLAAAAVVGAEQPALQQSGNAMHRRERDVARVVPGGDLRGVALVAEVRQVLVGAQSRWRWSATSRRTGTFVSLEGTGLVLRLERVAALDPLPPECFVAGYCGCRLLVQVPRSVLLFVPPGPGRV